MEIWVRMKKEANAKKNIQKKNNILRSKSRVVWGSRKKGQMDITDYTLELVHITTFVKQSLLSCFNEK